jgi:predicted GNAT superfamily acetyltransferase
MRSLEKTIAVRDRRFLLKVETSPAAADYAKYEALREEIWGFPEDHLASPLNMMSENVFHEGGSLFIGAFAEDGPLAGFCYGYVGLRDPAAGYLEVSNLRFYAQYAGVCQAYRGLGLMVRLKEFQREIVRELLGVPTIICTCDPLTGVNADRNIHRFGMDVLDYRVDTYGEYGGLLNRPDVPTDRFLLSWDLDRPDIRPDLDEAAVLGAPETIRAGLRTAAGTSGPLEVVEAVLSEAQDDVLLVRVPLDLYRMLRETDVADPAVRRIPVDWRLATRQVFTALLARGYRVVDFLKDRPRRPGHHYVLKRQAPREP